MERTYSQLLSEARQELFVQGEAGNLVDSHNRMFVEAMVDIQRWVNCFQKNNIKIHPFCSTYYKCGTSIIPKPDGIVKKLWVVERINPDTGKPDKDAPIDWCTRIQYEQIDPCKISQYNKESVNCGCSGQSVYVVSGVNASLCNKTIPQPTDEDWDHIKGLPMGHHYPQDSTDEQCRALRGVWSLIHDRIHIAPWINSNEVIVVEYDGIKKKWEDDDIVPSHVDFDEAVRNYVAHQHELIYGDKKYAQILEQDYWESRKKLIYDCQQETRTSMCGEEGPGKSGANQSQIEVDGQILRPTLEGQGTCGDVEAVQFWPPAGATVAFPTFVQLSTITANATIYFTADGNEPNADSTKYTGPFQIDRNTVVRAIAVKDGCFSAVTQSGYKPFLTDEELAEYGPVEFWRFCNELQDRAGAWYVFEPNGGYDTKWGLNLPAPRALTLDTAVIYRTQDDGVWDTGQVWSTILKVYPIEMAPLPFDSYPLVWFNQSDEQINFAYKSKDLIELTSGKVNKFTMFGDVVLTGHDWYKLILTFRDVEVYFMRDGKLCNDGDTPPLGCILFEDDDLCDDQPEDEPDPTTTTSTTSTTTPMPSSQLSLTVSHESSPQPCANSTWFGVNIYSGQANFGIRSFDEALNEPIEIFWNTQARTDAGQPCFSGRFTLRSSLGKDAALSSWPSYSVSVRDDGTYSVS